LAAINLEGMDASPTSLRVRSPFDRNDVADSPSPASRQPVQPTRGIGWVIKWTVAAGVLLYSATVLVEFAYSLAAEQMLGRAARAAALEATLPRATLHSIEQSARRRLGDSAASRNDLKLALLQNGAWVSRRFQPRGGDRLTVTVTMPAQALMPNWLRSLTIWRDDATIRARAERSMPGRQLSPSED
jgi:hypothetical protein